MSGTKLKKTTPRKVPGFSMQAYQKNTVTTRPRADVTRNRRTGSAVVAATAFATNFNRPDFPLTAVYGATADRRFRWRVPFETVNYETYMPLMADGLRDRLRPYATCATLGLWDMVARDHLDGERVLAALPRMVMPLRLALDAGPRNWPAMVRALKTLQMMATVVANGRVARALVPYYRQLLPPVSAFLHGPRPLDVTATDGLDPTVTYNLADLCDDTLVTLERNGGPCAYPNIKYAIPTYESRVTVCPAAKNGRNNQGNNLQDQNIIVHII